MDEPSHSDPHTSPGAPAQRPKRRRRRTRASLSRDYDRQWNQIFSTERNFTDDRPFIDALREVGADGDDLDLFLSPYEGPVPSCESEDIKRFCANTPLPSSQSDYTADEPPAKAWLDDREKSTKNARSYSGLLSAAQLYESMMKPRFKLKDTPDADRRLIYIPNLSPDYVLALARTASYHQIEALREAIWRYLKLQPSIRVHIPFMGFTIFRLEFHVPYYALRWSVCNSANSSSLRHRKRATRACTDLSFLMTDFPTASADNGNHVVKIHEAMTSIVVCGSDESRWTAYAFVDTEFSGAPVVGDEYEDSIELNEDPIASDRTGPELEADNPIWDPREYFLRIVDLRMKRQVLQEWRYIVGVVDRCVEDRRTAHPVTPSGIATIEYMRGEFSWTIQTIELLHKLRQRFDMIFEVWKRFNSPQGDIQYFARVPGHTTNLAPKLSGIRESFEELTNLEARLRSINQSCDKDCRILELRMSFESNRVNIESLGLNNQSLRLSLEASVLNQKTHQVTFEASQVALGSQKTAQKTSRTAQLSLSMNLIVQSVTIVIAYFSTPQAIFRFDRNAKSFIASVLLVIVGVRLINHALLLADQHDWGRRLKAWIVAVWKKRRLDVGGAGIPPTSV